ncbi:dolichyldiphosphatase 1-like [Zophobas morio]|uniref:dolichyldiphosphatase 1-like n=1 Tax=Zophobas morio TaxID=2755281 RepID=UPI003083B0F0
MDNNHNLEALSLTLVEYVKGDFYGKTLALTSLLPLFLISSMATVIFIRRDLQTIFFFTGVILNELLNFILKTVYNQARPTFTGYHHRGVYSKAGMPSNHAQFVSFFAFYLSWFLVMKCETLKGWKILHIAVIWAPSVLCITSRVYLRYHTLEQVLSGMFFGFIFFLIWASLTSTVRPSYGKLTALPLCRFFLIKDTSKVKNITEFECECVHQFNLSINKKD